MIEKKGERLKENGERKSEQLAVNNEPPLHHSKFGVHHSTFQNYQKNSFPASADSAKNFGHSAVKRSPYGFHAKSQWLKILVKEPSPLL
ncbi:MAG: hypothetical protein ACXIUD_18775, partial [Mongoliitalea sp.]